MSATTSLAKPRQSFYMTADSFIKPIAPGWLGWAVAWKDIIRGIVFSSDIEGASIAKIKSILSTLGLDTIELLTQESITLKDPKILISLSEIDTEEFPGFEIHKRTSNQDLSTPNSPTVEISSFRSDELECLPEAEFDYRKTKVSHLGTKLIPEQCFALTKLPLKSPLFVFEKESLDKNLLSLIPVTQRVVIDRNNYTAFEELEVYRKISVSSVLVSYSAFPDTNGFLAKLSFRNDIPFVAPLKLHTSYHRYLGSDVCWPSDMASSNTDLSRTFKALRASLKTGFAAEKRASIPSTHDQESIYDPIAGGQQRSSFSGLPSKSKGRRHYLESAQNQLAVAESLSELIESGAEHNPLLNWIIDHSLFNPDVPNFIEAQKYYRSSIPEYGTKFDQRLQSKYNSSQNTDVRYLLTQKRLIRLAEQGQWGDYQLLYGQPEAEAFPNDQLLHSYINLHSLSNSLSTYAADPSYSTGIAKQFEHSWERLKQFTSQSNSLGELEMYHLLVSLRFEDIDECEKMRDSLPGLPLNLSLAYILALILMGRSDIAEQRLLAIELKPDPGNERFEHWLYQYFVYNCLIGESESALDSLRVFSESFSDYLTSDRNWSPGFLSKQALTAVAWRQLGQVEKSSEIVKRLRIPEAHRIMTNQMLNVESKLNANSAELIQILETLSH